ncbi:MAG TPA: DDE-type integrase/transposase/recombinase, partial [Bacillus sp. (in: firmicutes)]|nr:DDE-type integrase/transposase/recombinase [Bacillus sp. (in: firmicutes)]
IAVKGPFYQIGIDIKGPLPVTAIGNRYLIVAMDYLTKWPEAKPLKQAKAVDVAEFIFKEVISRHGVPEVILTDRGTEFNNQWVNELCRTWQTKHRLTSPYRPQTNGMVERFNRTIGECLAKLSDEREWDENIEAVLLAYRTKKHESTGFTPFQLIYGRQAILPIELKVSTYRKEEMDALLGRTKEIIENNDSLKAQQRIKLLQEKRKQTQNSDRFRIGDKVLLHQTHLENNFSAKLEAKWIGPYFIHEVYEKSNYKLRTLDGKLMKNSVHGNRLKKYFEEILEPWVMIEDFLPEEEN